MTSHSHHTSTYTKIFGDFITEPDARDNGSFSLIHKARLKDTTNTKWLGIGRNTVALKSIYCPEGSANFKKIIESERLALKYLPRHPGLVHLYGSFQLGDFFCIVSEYLEGGNLLRNGIMKSDFDEECLRRAMRDASGGLLAMHNAGLLHRDIKADNLMLTEHYRVGRTKIIDFGFVHRMTEKEPEPDILAGSMRYLAPEQIRDSLFRRKALNHPNQESQNHAKFMTRASKKTDVWALGIKNYLKKDDIDRLNLSPEGKDWIKVASESGSIQGSIT
ncbi:serine threonine [Pyrrhoderma noxium]|uniref:Serine threonine n=1 Tax=Pyrrhoderma noxium TaxID=2282107 RepID=A0A286U7T8_9AGAM|nr:serine threonine [Pyrrhoderma noxium]